MSMTRKILSGFLLSVVVNCCLAHTTSDAFLYLSTDENSVTGRWDIHLRDAELAVGLDLDGNGQIHWGELYSRRDSILQALADAITLKTKQGLCAVAVDSLQAAERTDGIYASALITAQCPRPIDALFIDYRFLFDLDAQHKALVAVSGTIGEHNAVISAQSGTVAFSLGAASLWQTMLDYFRHGTWHIWVGLDHILFLIALLLPVGSYASLRDGPAGAWPVIGKILRIVTAFSVAHSITLTLAALDILELPSRWVESAIAASVILAAAISVVPRLGRHLIGLTFCFGLIHGLGFAGVLSELGLPVSSRIAALAAFNIGVEFGQLAIVILAIPLIMIWRNSDFYLRRAVPAVSASIAALASVWLFERVFAF